MATVFERVRKVAIAQLGVQENEVAQDSSFSADLGADSLDQVEMMMALEEEFTTPERKISIPDEESEKMLTVQDAVDYLHSIGISDMQAPPKPVEKSGFPRINLPRPNMPKPNFNRSSQPRQERQGQGQPRPSGQTQPRGGEQRRDNRPRRDRQPGNQQRQGFNPRPTPPPHGQPQPPAVQPQTQPRPQVPPKPPEPGNSAT